ncbi:hypothetical protein [Cohnella sp. REN36]|uniref:hypothetical protein n=1 Tax=Cohnella sp. REN36 TaxID=2887347 RepID=UPI001D14DA4C|nr:hypothetical protein [Cohnella sp. REN36]MCC3376837.1 hypothetical protein [Cohnella sp. REN36]
MTIGRERILSAIVPALEKEPRMLALWLEGADGTGSVDPYSDIDLVICTREGCADEAFGLLEACLKQMGSLDFAYEQPGRPADNRYKVYHLENSPAHLFLDVTVQSEGIPAPFVIEDITVVPVVLFDKAGIVKYRNVDREALRQELLERLFHARGLYGQRSRAVKYTARGLFLESLIYYQKYVLDPLVEVLRILHTPIQADAWLVHASRDFPPETAATLAHLYGVTTTADIAVRIREAEEWFGKAASEAEARLSVAEA